MHAHCSFPAWNRPKLRRKWTYHASPFQNGAQLTDGKKQGRQRNVTRPELVNKLLLTIDTLITQVNESNDPALVAGLGDKLAKLSAVIEKLDKKANVVDVIEVFMAFSKWIEYRSTIDPEVTPELVRAINKYQDLYITEQMGIK